ncbi:uncharacterized protein P174DRAFT_221826 [Aspergillus novofumigatus IBT 16806]|uniref:Uncharacterized protein n=1 Tax=Aspergillus novofumigatus (strain IBT 16806) TaxID=1392255 RepID=A0A2I1C645_ASPN1|nr:uncharacterized protein P174DRAFT_221826 [Aspergillus novofumigatus IBT 16806]PKX93120.1 hypothetical protein P174DRAFT_221826 [Aspergillus novofumigatus IBT 16806]
MRCSFCSFERSTSVISQLISRIIEYLWCICWRILGKTGAIFERKRSSWVGCRVGYSIPLCISFVWFCFPVETRCLEYMLFLCWPDVGFLHAPIYAKRQEQVSVSYLYHC